MTRTRLLALCCAVTLALFAAGCGSSRSQSQPNVFDEEGTASTTTTTADPYAVPKVIDAAYVNKVLAAHNEIVGQVRRDVLANHKLSDEDTAKLKAIYIDDALSGQLRVWTDAALIAHPEFKPNPGDPIETVKTIHHADSDCIWVTTVTDEDANLT